MAPKVCGMMVARKWQGKALREGAHMQSVEFLAWCRFGRLVAGGETYVDMELTDEEITRLAAQDKDECSFAECEAVMDIYHKVYEKAVAQITEELRESDALGTAYMNGEERADEVYQIGVAWPTE